MEDESLEHPNDYITCHTTSEAMLLKKDGEYIIGKCIAEINEMTAEFKQYHHVVNENPPELEVFTRLLKNGKPPEFIPHFKTHPLRNYVSP